MPAQQGVSAILTNIADYRVTVTTPVDGPDANKLRAAVEDAGHDVTLVETEREDGQIDDAAIDEACVKYAARSES